MNRFKKGFLFKTIGSSLIALSVAIPFSFNLTSCDDGSKTVNLISLNDFHGNLDEDVKKDSDGNITSVSHPGALRLANSIYDFEKNHNNDTNMVLGAGDLYQGTYVSNIFRGESTGNILNALGMRISSIGNHEFDWGQAYLGSSKGTLEKGRTTFFNSNNGDQGSRNITSSKTSNGNFEGFVSANLYSLKPGTNRDNMDPSDPNKYHWQAGDTPINWTGVEPYRILSTNDGFKIAFVGYTTIETASTTLKSSLDGVTFLDASKPEEASILQETINQAHNQADMTVLLAHEGASPKVSNPNPNKLADWSDANGIIPIVNNLNNIDLVLSAHTHQEYNLEVPDHDGKKIPVIQAEKYGDRFSKVSVKYKLNNDHFEIKNIDPEIINVNEQSKQITEQQIRDRATKTPSDSLLNKVIKNYDYWVNQGNQEGETIIFNNVQELSLEPEGRYQLNSIGSGICNMLFTVAEANDGIGFETSQATKDKYENAPKIALINQGGIRTEKIPSGNVSYQKWYSAMPFDNEGFTFAIKVGNLINSLNSTYADFGLPQFFSKDLKLVIDSNSKTDTRIGQFKEIRRKDTNQAMSNDDYVVVLTNDFFFQNGDHSTFSNSESENGADPASVNHWSGVILREVIKDYYYKNQNVGTFNYNFDPNSLIVIE